MWFFVLNDFLHFPNSQQIYNISNQKLSLTLTLRSIWYNYMLINYYQPNSIMPNYTNDYLTRNKFLFPDDFHNYCQLDFIVGTH